jgi:hypothetical protein
MVESDKLLEDLNKSINGMTAKSFNYKNNYARVLFKQERPFTEEDLKFFAKEINNYYEIRIDKEDVEIFNVRGENGLKVEVDI